MNRARPAVVGVGMARAEGLFTVGGLPVHPLVVHAVVVLLPLAAVATIGLAISPTWRRRYGWPVLAITVLAVAAVPVAQETGEQLAGALAAAGAGDPDLAQHADLGPRLLPIAIAFGVTVIVMLFTGRVADRERDAGGSMAATRTWRRVSAVTSALALVAAVASIALVVVIGHSGATVVWHGVGR
jgi:hypothetical protein